jgi:hypothetical protein
MKYALIRQDDVTEIREDKYSLPDGAFPLTDEQYDQLISGQYILQNNQIIANPNPTRNA